MHVGAVMIFEGPPPAYDDFLEHVRGRLHLVPRFRQKLAFPRPRSAGPSGSTTRPSTSPTTCATRRSPRPAPRSSCATSPGGVFSQALDRSKPLWEIWLVQGLEKNRFALINKTHHALVDGVAGVDIATVLFDLKPVPEQHEPEPRWVPTPAPSSAELAARGIEELAETPFKLARRALRAAADPEATVRKAVDAVEALGEVAWNFTDPAPDVPLNVEIGSHRRFSWTPLQPRGLQADQERARRHRQRRRPHRRQRRASQLAAGPRHQDRGPGAARPGAGLDPDRGRARPASATGSRRCGVRCPSTSRTRSSGCRSSRGGWTTSRSPSRRSAPR